MSDKELSLTNVEPGMNSLDIEETHSPAYPDLDANETSGVVKVEPFLTVIFSDTNKIEILD